MKKILLLFILTLTLNFAGIAQSMTCPNFCVLNIGNVDTTNNVLDVTIYNGDTVFVNYPIVVLVNSLGDTIANINNFFYFFGHPAGDTVVHTIPTTVDSIPAGFTGTVYLTDPMDSTTCMFSYPMACTVGITEFVSANSILIYPNPAADLINISTEGNPLSSARLYDVTGKMLRSISNPAKQFTIERGDLASGIYFIQVISGDKVLSRKIILE